ncbi:MAG: hypothetical protein Q9177_003347 [Variospora cf. flavescens]
MFRFQPERSSGSANYDCTGQSIQRLNVPARPWNRGANFVGRFDDPHYPPGPDLRQPLRQWELEDRGEKFPEECRRGGYPMPSTYIDNPQAGADSVRYSWKPLLSNRTGASGIPQMIATRPLAPKISDSLAGSGGAGQSPPLVQAERIPEALWHSALKPLQHSFNQYMSPVRRRKRRSLTDAEKKHAKNVRKQGACPQCKSKKRKCSHVADPTDDGPSPGSQGTESGDSEAPTPESDAGMNYEVGPELANPDGFSWEDYLNSDLL